MARDEYLQGILGNIVGSAKDITYPGGRLPEEKVTYFYMIRNNKGYYSEHGIYYWGEQEDGERWTNLSTVQAKLINIKQRWVEQQIEIIEFELKEK